MASKKSPIAPSKKVTKVARREKEEHRQLLGKKILYIGIMGARLICPTCGKTYRKTMASEYKQLLYCSEQCVQRAAHA